MKITYNTIQLDSAIDFLIANNPAASIRGRAEVRKMILDYMIEIANMNKFSTISTLGFMVAGGATLTPKEQKLHAYRFHVFVDPCVASNEYNFITVDTP